MVKHYRRLRIHLMRAQDSYVCNLPVPSDCDYMLALTGRISLLLHLYYYDGSVLFMLFSAHKLDVFEDQQDSTWDL
jgi:hypothetical protein